MRSFPNIFNRPVYHLFVIGIFTLSNLCTTNSYAQFTKDEAASAIIQDMTDTKADWGDYDNDGDLDLAIVGSNGTKYAKIYRNNDGIFEDIEADLLGVSGYGNAMWGDFDGDQDLDLVITGETTIGEFPDIQDIEIAYIYRNDDGVFVNHEAGLTGVAGWAQWSDYDGDGDLDIALAGRIGADTDDDDILKIYNNDQGVFTEIDLPIQLTDRNTGISIDWGDYDNDGDEDLFVSVTGDFNWDLEQWYSSVLRNDDGVFTAVDLSIPGFFDGHVKWGDYDADGDLDLAVMGYDNLKGPVTTVYQNNDGVFEDIGDDFAGNTPETKCFAGFLDWEDYDSDGDLDLLVSGVGGPMFTTIVFRNDEGVFINVDMPIPGTWGYAIWGDYDNDFDPDILIGGIQEIEGSYYNLTELYTNEIRTAHTIQFEPVGDKTYGDSDFDISATSSAGLEVSYELISGPATITDQTVSITGAGEVLVRAYYPGNETYNPSKADLLIPVEKVPLTITVDDELMTYGAVIPEFGVSYNGFVNDEDETDLLSLPEANTIATSESGTGSYAIHLTGGTSDNYDLVLVDGTLTIEKATLSVIAKDQSMTYGDAVPELDISYDGFVNDEDELALLSLPEASTIATSESGAGNYAIHLTGGASDNYELVLVEGTLTIEKATLTATPNDQSMTYGGAVPELDISYEGFVNDEDETDLLSPPEASTTATSESNVDTYNIVLSGGTSDNYELLLKTGTLTIEKASLTATANDKSMIYGDAVPEFDITYTGFVNEDDETDLWSPLETSTTATSQSGAGIYPIQITGGTSDNYDLILVDGTLTIEKATLTATANDQTMKVGETVPELEITYAGFVNDDAISDLGEVPVASTTATSESESGIYIITVSGGRSDNYELILVDGELIIGEMVLAAKPGSIAVRAYPNPTHDFIKIEVKSPSEIRLLNLQGKLINSEIIEKQSLLNIMDLESGIYLLEVINQDHTFRQRIIKTN